MRRAGQRVRITAQLIEAAADQHLWAERYDGDLADVFALQDEVTAAIVTAIEPALANSERQRARRKAPERLDAWETYQRGLWHLYLYTAEDSPKALEFFGRALELDPSFAAAHAGLAWALYYHIVLGFTADREADLARAMEAGKTAVLLDENDSFAQVALGRIHTIRGEHEAAISICERAIALNPNYASAYFGRAHSLWQSGRPAEALPALDEAMRLSPRDPLIWAYKASKAIALILLGRYDEALDWAQDAQRHPNMTIWAMMPEVSALGLLGRQEEARTAFAHMRRMKHDVSLVFVDQAVTFSQAEDRERFVSGLPAAGVPG